MSIRSVSALAIVAAALGTAAAPAMARTVHVMGLTIQQPDNGPQNEVAATGSVNDRHGAYRGRYDGYDGRTVKRQPASR